MDSNRAKEIQAVGILRAAGDHIRQLAKEAGNVGWQAVSNAMQPGDRCCGPAFAPLSLPLQTTDFNDLLRFEGIGALQRQLEALWPASSI